MKRTLNIPSTGIESGQVDTVRRVVIARLFAGLRVLGVSFLFIGTLIMVFYLFTADGRGFALNFLVYLFTGENAIKLVSHLAGLFAIILLIGVLAVFTTLLHLNMSPTSRYDKVLAALRFILKYDTNKRVRSEATKDVAKLDAVASTLHQEHEERDDTLVSPAQGEQGDASPRVSSVVVEELELEQRPYQHEHNQLHGIIFRDNSWHPVM